MRQQRVGGGHERHVEPGQHDDGAAGEQHGQVHGHDASEPAGRERAGQRAQRRDRQCRRVRGGNLSGQLTDRGQRVADRREAQCRVELHGDNDAADRRRETRGYGIGHEGDVAPELQRAKDELQRAGQQHDAGDRRGLPGEASCDARHQNGDRARRSRNLSRGSAEERRENARAYGTVDAGDRPEPGGNPEGETHRQGDGRCIQAAAQILAPVTSGYSVEAELSQRVRQGSPGHELAS